MSGLDSIVSWAVPAIPQVDRNDWGSLYFRLGDLFSIQFHEAGCWLTLAVCVPILAWQYGLFSR